MQSISPLDFPSFALPLIMALLLTWQGLERQILEVLKRQSHWRMK